MNIEELTNVGINYEEGLQRFSGMKELYEKFLNKFLEDKTFSELKAAMEEKDYDAAFQYAHTIKGVVGNLSFVDLFHDVDQLTEALRHKELDQVDALYDKTEETYNKVIKVLKEQV